MQNDSHFSYILGCPQDDGKVAILCRSSGGAPGPAICPSKTEAMKLKTNLANDPRGKNNHRAIEIIRSLLIYKMGQNSQINWQAGDLWGYLDQNEVQCDEAKSFWN